MSSTLIKVIRTRRKCQSSPNVMSERRVSGSHLESLMSDIEQKSFVYFQSISIGKISYRLAFFRPLEDI